MFWLSFCFLFTDSLKRRHIRPLHRQSLSELMNGPIRQKLGVIPKNVTWGGHCSLMIYTGICVIVTFYDSYKCSPVSSGQAEAVFESMAGDFMKPVVDIVDQLLAAGVNVTIYNGQLDLIVDTMGEDVNHFRMATLDQHILDYSTWAFYTWWFRASPFIICSVKTNPFQNNKVSACCTLIYVVMKPETILSIKSDLKWSYAMPFEVCHSWLLVIRSPESDVNRWCL